MPHAQPLLAHFAPFTQYFEQFQPETWRFVMKEGFDVQCNVKVLMDAFLEVYHLKSIHTNTVDRFLDHRGTTIALYRNGLSLMVTPNRRPDWQDPGTRGMRAVETATVISAKNNPSFNFYPNLVTPVDPTGCPFLLFWPTSDTSMRIECHWFAPDWGPGPPPEGWKMRIANFDRILEEDLQFAAAIQQSLQSAGLPRHPAELPGAAHLPLARGARPAHRHRAHPAGAARAAAPRTAVGELTWARSSAASSPSAPTCRGCASRARPSAQAMGWLSARRTCAPRPGSARCATGTRTHSPWRVAAARECLRGAARRRRR